MGDGSGGILSMGVNMIACRDGNATTRQFVEFPLKDYRFTREVLVNLGRCLSPFVAKAQHKLTFEVPSVTVGLLSGLWDHSTDEVLVYLQQVRSVIGVNYLRQGREVQAVSVLAAALFVSCPSLGFLLDAAAARFKALYTPDGIALTLEWTHPCDLRLGPPRPQCAEQVTWEFFHPRVSPALPAPSL